MIADRAKIKVNPYPTFLLLSVVLAESKIKYEMKKPRIPEPTLNVGASPSIKPDVKNSNRVVMANVATAKKATLRLAGEALKSSLAKNINFI